MSIVTPSVFSMTDSGACSINQNDLCCISSSPPTAGNGVRPCSDVHDFWSLRSRGIDASVSSMTDSVDLVVEGKSSKTNEYKRYSGALPWKDKEAKDKPLNNYQGAVLRFERLKRRLAYTCILFLATVFSMIDSVEIVMEGQSSKTDENKRHSGALSWKDKKVRNKPFNNYQCVVLRFEHLKQGLAYICILFFMCAVMWAVHLEQTSQVHTYNALSRGQVILIREDFDKPISCSTGVIVNVRESSDNIVRSATVKIGDKTYNRPIQRLYELEGWDQGQSTNKLLHLTDSDTPSKTTDDLYSETTAKQAKALVDPIITSSKELTDVMGKEAARTGDSGGSLTYHTRSGRRVKPIQRLNL